MNKFKSLYLLFMTFVLALSSSCSHEESTITDKLQKYVGNDVDVVVAGNLQRVLDVTESKVNSDGSVELSDYMQKLVNILPSSARNNINDVLDADGFEWSSAVCAVRIGERTTQTICIWSVTDEDKYIDYFVNTYHFRKGKTGDFTMLYDDGISIAMRDNLVFLVAENGKGISPEKTATAINDWQSNAKAKPIAEWKYKYLDNGDVASALVNFDKVGKKIQEEIDDADFYKQTRPDVMMLNRVLPDARKVTIGMTFNIDGLSATLNGKFFTSSGEAYNPQQLDGSFNSSLLKYITDKDIAVVGIANASFHTSLLSHSITGLGSEIITKWLDNFEGSLMLATGLKDNNLASIVSSPTNSLHFVIAADCKPGKAPHALDAFAGIIPFADNASVSKHVPGSELRFKVPTSYIEDSRLEPWEDGYYRPVYTNFVMKADGNVLLISNEEIDPTPVADFTADMFKNKSFVSVVHLAKNNRLMSTINAPFGADLKIAIEKSQFEIKFSLNNTSKNLIHVLVDFAGPALNR